MVVREEAGLGLGRGESERFVLTGTGPPLNRSPVPGPSASFHSAINIIIPVA